MAKIVERHWTGADGTERRGWQVDFTDQSGKRVRRQFARRKDADAFMVTARAQVQVGTYTPDSTSATIGEACDLWLDRAAAEGLERNTREQYRIQVAHLLAVIDRDAKLSRLTRARCEQARDAVLQAHSRQTARKVVQALRMVLADARRRGLVAVNVAADTRVGTDRRHKAKIRAGADFPMPAEVRAMLEVAGPKARAMVALAALAGLRPSELRALRWSDVELGRHPTVTVSQRADAWCSIGSPKAEASRRSVPLGEVTVRAFKAWKLAQAPVVTHKNGEERRRPHVLLFGTATDRPDMLGNLQRRLLDPLCSAAGAPRYTWHSLRHYAVSSWLAARIDLKTAQAWAGHATLAMTLDTYGHLIPRDDDHDRIASAERALLVT
ncbi:MAG: tyrosine-type recombinase/integrase [Geminicoccaceae bacterium]